MRQCHASNAKTHPPITTIDPQVELAAEFPNCFTGNVDGYETLDREEKRYQEITTSGMDKISTGLIVKDAKSFSSTLGVSAIIWAGPALFRPSFSLNGEYATETVSANAHTRVVASEKKESNEVRWRMPVKVPVRKNMVTHLYYFVDRTTNEFLMSYVSMCFSKCCFILYSAPLRYTFTFKQSCGINRCNQSFSKVSYLGQ